MKSVALFDDMVRRQDHHRGLMIPACDPSGSERHGRCGIALCRFGHDIFRGEIREQRAHGALLIHIREDQNSLMRHEAVEAIDRFFQQRFFRNEPEQLLRP